MQRRQFIAAALATGTLAEVSAATKISDNITAEITALLRETEALWDAQDTKRLRELWDQDDSEPFYLAGEQNDWFIGWEQLNGYLAPAKGPKVTEAIKVRFYNIKARLLAPDLAFAAYWMRTEMKLIFQPKPFASDNRVSATFRRKPEGWRYLTYTEAFQAPNMYINHLMEKDVSDEYQTFFDEAKKRK
ncbi:MAG: nuclear transport factor 2 family protein [Gammaproteobacteria bacterium]|nr:nuclear transport factor 2 family protein [Gammaproteobacteria bacterium]